MKKKRALLVSLFLSLAFPFLLLAQDKPVTGKITNKVNGDPLAGATVTVKGGAVSTTTDATGNFSIQAPPGAILLISYTGFGTQEFAVAPGSAYNFTLNELSTSMNEVIVVGYGTQKKRAVTTAISSVKASDLENMPVFRVEQSLQGRVAGVSITASSGQPGAASTIYIRGISSVNGGSQPLYVVDGVVVDGGIEYLNQADIETMDVLKDAASAAIYGARGGAGVVLITTKRGRAGRINVNYTGYAGVQKAWRKIPVLNAEQYATLYNEASVAAGGNIRFPDPAALGKGTDWQAQVFNDNAPMQNHELSISAGSDKSTYFTSFGFLNQEGIVASSNSKFKRFTARFNSNHKITKAITFGNNIGYTYINSTGVGTNDEWGTPLNRAINMDPITPVIETDPAKLSQSPYTMPDIVRDENGNPYGISSIVTSEILNPVAGLKVAQGNGWSHKILGNIYLEIAPIEGLKLRSTIGGDLAFWGDQSFSPVFYLNATNQNLINDYTRNSNRALNWVWENTASYNRTFGKHDATLLIGITAQRFAGETQGGTRTGIPATNIREASLAFPVSQANQYFWGGEWESTLSSLFGRLQYAYDNKYLFSAVMRRDGSSKFGSNNIYGYFPSVSAGWVISEENFWNPKVASFLKLRASYGENGNNNLEAFRFVSTVSGGRNYVFGDQLINGVSPNAIANPDLKWETVVQTNIGLDAVLLNNHLSVTVDVYNKKTTDMLQNVRVPMYVGNNGPVGNVATMENRGIELAVGYNQNIGDFKFSVNLNGSYNKNEITYLGPDKDYLQGLVYGPQGVEYTRHIVGNPYGAFFGYKTNGLFQTPEDVTNYKNKNGDPIQPLAKPGDLRYVDYNGDGLISAEDRVILGNPNPDFTYGFTVNAAYKGFDVILFGQGIAGSQVLQAIRRFDLPSANWSTKALDRWHGEGTSNSIPRVTLDDQNKNWSNSSDIMLQDGDYFRIKTLQIGYSLPQHIINRIGLNKVRVFFTGNNLITFTKYDGFDPEIGGGSFGVDRGIYPQPRALLFGLNVGF
ncbi:SusC/RagA family TonB-linked outer membrane protein [Flavihumibacter petaseus]|uniref:Putative TonB-dependent receptor n=1 Tax=Flavihumibacter petaseus NBRC 106054 TaxID=1220578 RepID=A0A0E9MXJ1_9BACT|nr:TonB-dependent receptor [Flavihumibacter petaseus]GAO42223.1 putative TonB-dependent receptor [Flavihumibacter petaseus NBRC 106054]